MPRTAAIDLGTTRIKAGVLAEHGALTDLVSEAAPEVRMSGRHRERRESSAAAYLDAATRVLQRLCERVGEPLELGLACQRSSFAIWERDGGRQRTPLISWQDRRAASWCERRSARSADVTRVTGLRLSPHYAGAKLAWLFEQDPGWRDGLVSGELMFGTLDALALWHWTGGRHHETDLTIAARTMLADPRTARWSDEMLELFGVPPDALPRIAPTAERRIPLQGDLSLAASVADQAAAALAVLGDRSDAALVNLGTGGFVLRSTGSAMTVRPGYLAGAMFGGPAAAGGGVGPTLFALEGAINAIARSVDRYGAPPTPLPDVDPAPEAFCLPDGAGTGSPHWRSDLGLTFSTEADALDATGRRRVVLEGVVFRVREILADLFDGERPARLFLSGGIARDPFAGAALAACLATPIELLDEADVTLLGAARLADGRAAEPAPLRSRIVAPGGEGGYLERKYVRWKRWLRDVLS
jgi:glycerol kinase